MNTELILPCWRFASKILTKDKYETFVAFQAVDRLHQDMRPQEDIKGVIKRTPLFDIPGFDIEKQCLPDPMHYADAGVGKFLFEMT